MIPFISSTLQEARLLSVTIWKSCIYMPMWWFLSSPHTYTHTHTCGHSHSSAVEKINHQEPIISAKISFLRCSNHLKPNSIVFRVLKWVRGNHTIWAFSIQLHAPGFSLLSSHTLYSLSLFHSSFSLALSSFLYISIFLSLPSLYVFLSLSFSLHHMLFFSSFSYLHTLSVFLPSLPLSLPKSPQINSGF